MEVPPPGWKDILWRVYRGIFEHRVLAIAAGVTFSLFFVSRSGTIRSHLETSGVLSGGALSVIGDQITRVSAPGKTTLGFTFLAAFGVSLWSANAGTKALFDALNIVSLGVTLIGIVLLLIVLAAMVVLPTVLAYLGIASKTEWLLKIAGWPLLVLLVSFGLNYLPLWADIYRYGPSRDRAQWRWLTSGSAFAAVAWLLMSLLFSWYAENFDRFNETTARSAQSWVS